MNHELLEQKEKLYADYRGKIKEYESTKRQAEDFTNVLQACHIQMDRLEREIGSMRKLIDYMIRNDLDPVSAKLKYDDEHESKINIQRNTYPASSATSIAVTSIGAIGATGVYTQQSHGIVAKQVEDLFKDSNKYDSLWLDY